MFRSIMLKKWSIFGLYFLLFLPILVYNNALFPFVFLKGFTFRLVVEILFLLAIFLLIKDNFYKLPKNYLALSLSLFLLFLPLVSLFSVNGLENWWGNFERMEGGFYYVHLLVYFWLFISYFRADQLWRKFFICIGISSILIDIFALAQKIGIPMWFYNYSGRVGGTLGNAAYLASAAVFNLVFLLFFFHKYRSYRWLSVTAIALNLLTILASATRGSILALLVVSFLFLVFSFFKKGFLPQKQKKLLGATLGIFVLGVFSIFLFKDSPLIQNVEWLRRMSSISLSESTASSRLVAWGYSWQAFQDKPIFGWGIDNYDLAFNKYFDHSMSEEWFDRAHNNYFDILVTGGIFSLLLYLIFIFSVFLVIWKLYKKDKIDYWTWQIFTFIWLAYLIQNIFIFDTVNTWIFVVPFVAFLVYLQQAGQAVFQEKYVIIWPAWSKNALLLAASLGTVFIVYASIIKPLQSNILAFKAYQLFVDKDFSSSLEKLDRATSQTYNNYGVNDILLGFYRILEPDLEKIPPAVLLQIVDLFSQRQLEIRSKIKFVSIDIFSMTKNINEQNIDRDIKILNELLEESPNRKAMYFQLGQLYALRNDKENSVANFEKAMAIKKDGGAIWNLATAYYFLKDTENFEIQARELIDGGYDMELDNLKLLVNYFENDKQDNVVLEKLFNKILEQSRTAENLFDMAVIKFRLQKMDEAKNIAAEALKLDSSLSSKVEKLFAL